MAGNKHSRKDEDDFVPETKRRLTSNGQGVKNNNSAAPLSKSFTKDDHHGTQKAVIIDLSDDEEHRIHNLMQPAKAIMKPLPQGSMTEDFPRFNSGTVYIMIDPKIRTYQYRLHKAVLSRVSPVFAKALQRPCPREAIEKFKVATNNDIGARFELFYSCKLRQWKLLRGPFTVWWQAEARTNATAIEDTSKLLEPSSNLNNIITPPAPKPATCINLDNAEAVVATPGILSSDIVASEISITNVTKDEESNFLEYGDKTHPLAPHGLRSPVELYMPLTSTTQMEKPDTGDSSASVKPEGEREACNDQPLVNLDAVTETESDQLTSINRDPGYLSVDPGKSEEDKARKCEMEDSNASISSLGIEETQVSATTNDLEDSNDHNEVPLLEPVRAGSSQPTVKLEKLEDIPIITAEQDELSVAKSTPTPNGVHLSAETSSEQDVGKQDVTAPFKPLDTTRPPIEICEAYNNLFLIFYSKPPIISKTSVSVAVEQCETLISIANRIEALPVIRPYLGNALGQFGKKLYTSVAAEPFRWLKISMMLESAVIFKEAMIHIVGAYVPGADGQINIQADIPQFVHELILFKVRQMDQQRMDVNERLFSSSIVVDSKTVTFSLADTSVFSTWLVVQIWRDWFCRQMASVHLNPHKTGQLYRTLAKSGDAYLTAAEVKAVIEKIREPVKVDPEELEEDLGLLKKFALEAVQGLCENNSMLDIQEAGIGYLTCTRIMDEELPWFETEQ